MLALFSIIALGVLFFYGVATVIYPFGFIRHRALGAALVAGTLIWGPVALIYIGGVETPEEAELRRLRSEQDTKERQAKITALTADLDAANDDEKRLDLVKKIRALDPTDFRMEGR